MITILDCYTDEPAGLGVPPYLGVYPRYLYGLLKCNVNNSIKNSVKNNVQYITIDDLRLWVNYKGKQLVPSPKQKTNISTNNLTKNSGNLPQILKDTDEMYIIIGVHTPGKYLSATPGTVKEISKLLKDFKFKKILCGPITCGGNQLFGGKGVEKIPEDFELFDVINLSYDAISEYAAVGADIIDDIDDLRVIEIETSRGCSRKSPCSFCTEPLKNKLQFRKTHDILDEMKRFYDKGAYYFRLGKQSCIYSYPDVIELLKQISKMFPKIKVLHIDNVNPVNVVADYNKNNAEITEAIVRYCTPGNIAAFGVESFDMDVVSQNNLNTTPQTALKAIEIINKFGNVRSNNGMHKFLPGLNIIFGLIGEAKSTHQENMRHLKTILDKYLVRRINIREVIPYEGTMLDRKVGNKIVKKHKKFYWKWRNQIRQEIDLPMLKKLFPAGTVVKDLYADIYDGNTTFLRQFGTYPIIIGVKTRLELKKFYNVKITGYMLRSLVGEVV